MNALIESPAVTPRPRTVRRRKDLSKAKFLRPADVFELTGIPASTLADFCDRGDPARRLKSYKLSGNGGRKGVRLVKPEDLWAWIEARRAAAESGESGVEKCEGGKVRKSGGVS